MFDTAEGYNAGGAEVELSVSPLPFSRCPGTNRQNLRAISWWIIYSGRIIKELKFRRSDIIVTTKIFFGTRKGPNDTGLSRKQ